MERKMVELSKRLEMVASMVTVGSVVCDVGCDHGYVSIYLVQNEISPKVIAMDIRKGPLSHAINNISTYHLKDKIVTRLSDGVNALNIGEADTLILAGMGGKLMQDILTKEKEKSLSFKELILQPQSEVPLFRKFLRENGLIIVQEEMVFEEGKFYPMMRAIPGDSIVLNDDDCLENLYGEFLLQKRHPVLKQFLDFEKKNLEDLLMVLEKNNKKTLKVKERYLILKTQLEKNEEARKYYNQS